MKTINLFLSSLILFRSLGALAETPEAAPTWKDFSTTEDGLSPATCTDGTQQCVFRHTTVLQEVTTVVVREGVSGPSELKTYDRATEDCAALANWAGHSDWRLPTMGELDLLRPDLVALFEQYPFLNMGLDKSGGHYFWTKSKRIAPALLPQEIQSQDPDMLWIEDIVANRKRQISPKAVVNFICIRDSIKIDTNWTDASFTDDGAPAKCSDTKHCAFTNNADGITWLTNRNLSAPNLFSDYRCANLRVGGLGGWRNPSSGELILANQKGIGYLPLINDRFFQLSTSIVSGYLYKNTFPVQENARGNFPIPAVDFPDTYKLSLNCVRDGATETRDTDHDGVPDVQDLCPHTPEKAAVWHKDEKLPDGSSADKFVGCGGNQTPKT